MIGACYGALHGRAGSDSEDGVPMSWVALLNDGAAVMQDARRLVELRQIIAKDGNEGQPDVAMGA